MDTAMVMSVNERYGMINIRIKLRRVRKIMQSSLSRSTCNLVSISKRLLGR